MGKAARLCATVLLGVSLAACSGLERAESPPSPSASHNAPNDKARAGRPFPTISAQPLDPAAGSAMQKELERWVSTGLITGVTAAVVSHGRVWSGAAGVDRTGTPLTAETGLTIGSVTKTVVAAEILRLVEAGTVELDSPASAYIESPLLANGVTVRQLLAMRSGIPQAVETHELVTETSTPWSVQSALALVPVRLSPPGVAFEYNNANYWLLGLVIEKVRGLRLGQVLAQDLFEPQGLSRITLQSEQPLPPPLARPGDEELWDITIPAKADGYLPFHSLATYVGAAAGIASDAPTLAKWGNQLYGGHVLTEPMLDEMLDVSDGDHYGLGFADFSDTSWNVDGGGHEGEQVGFRAVLISMEQPQLSVALLTPTPTKLGSYVQYLAKVGGLLP